MHTAAGNNICDNIIKDEKGDKELLLYRQVILKDEKG